MARKSLLFLTILGLASWAAGFADNQLGGKCREFRQLVTALRYQFPSFQFPILHPFFMFSSTYFKNRFVYNFGRFFNRVTSSLLYQEDERPAEFAALMARSISLHGNCVTVLEGVELFFKVMILRPYKDIHIFMVNFFPELAPEVRQDFCILFFKLVLDIDDDLVSHIARGNLDAGDMITEVGMIMTFMSIAWEKNVLANRISATERLYAPNSREYFWIAMIDHVGRDNWYFFRLFLIEYNRLFSFYSGDKLEPSHLARYNGNIEFHIRELLKSIQSKNGFDRDEFFRIQLLFQFYSKFTVEKAERFFRQNFDLLPKTEIERMAYIAHFVDKMEKGVCEEEYIYRTLNMDQPQPTSFAYLSLMGLETVCPKKLHLAPFLLSARDYLNFEWRRPPRGVAGLRKKLKKANQKSMGLYLKVTGGTRKTFNMEPNIFNLYYQQTTFNLLSVPRLDPGYQARLKVDETLKMNRDARKSGFGLDSKEPSAQEDKMEKTRERSKSSSNLIKFPEIPEGPEDWDPENPTFEELQDD